MLERLDTIIDLLQTIVNRLPESGKAHGEGACMPGEEPPGQLIPWITAEQVMEYLGIKETAYYRWVDKEILQPRGPGEHRYYLSDIRELMERRTYRKRR